MEKVREVGEEREQRRQEMGEERERERESMMQTFAMYRKIECENNVVTLGRQGEILRDT